MPLVFERIQTEGSAELSYLLGGCNRGFEPEEVGPMTEGGNGQ